MIEQVVSWMVGIFTVLSIPYVIYFNVLHFLSRWRCRKKEYLKPFNTCHESECRFSKYCGEYERVLTDEEIKKLEKLIEELQK